VIKRRVTDGVASYVLFVNQGWWDEVGKEPKHPRPLMETSYVSLEAARDGYRAQLDSLVRQGYIYSFLPPNPFADEDEVSVKYRVRTPGGSD
jgi:hypothetical protein